MIPLGGHTTPIPTTGAQLGRRSPEKLQKKHTAQKKPAKHMKCITRAPGTQAVWVRPAVPPHPELVERFMSEDNMSAAQRQKLALQAVQREYQRFDGDTGSSEVQGTCSPRAVSCVASAPGVSPCTAPVRSGQCQRCVRFCMHGLSRAHADHHRIQQWDASA